MPNGMQLSYDKEDYLEGEEYYGTVMAYLNTPLATAKFRKKDEAEAYEKANAEGKGGYSRLILSLNRPAEDFAREKEIGEVTKESFYGHEFIVVTLR